METLHYSTLLKFEINKKNDLLDLLTDELTTTAAYLRSAKFQGFENNFVNAQEMADRILEIRTLILKNY